MGIKELKNLLEEVAPTYYLAYENEMIERINYPIIIFFLMRKSFVYLADDTSQIEVKSYQISIISSSLEESITCETHLENILKSHDIAFNLTSEIKNENGSITTIYEIKTEEIINV